MRPESRGQTLLFVLYFSLLLIVINLPKLIIPVTENEIAP